MIRNPDYTREGPYDDAAGEYTRAMSELTGQYIDQFTVVPDSRTTIQKLDEAMARKPKCCQPGYVPVKYKPQKPSAHLTIDERRKLFDWHVSPYSCDKSCKIANRLLQMRQGRIDRIWNEYSQHTSNG